VHWTAQQIDDPVGRLRFLKSVAPRVEVSSTRKSPRIRVLAVAILLLATLLPLSRRVVRAEDGGGVRVPAAISGKAPYIRVAAPNVVGPRPGQSAEIWQVEKTKEFDSYSNGLRIENRYAIRTRPRVFLTFSATRPDDLRGEAGSAPIGIVFHTTESLQAPFEASENSRLKRVGESLAEYVRRRHSYNFLIDRFGRVFRMVEESDTADHAGHSVWANETHFYVNLNESFLGVSFEAQTAAGQEEAQVSPAQLRAAAMLTEMLRNRYRIPASNCVTHAQVSVNPKNMQVGYHMDWASSFPFATVGLPDNYEMASPALRLFGFQYDAAFARRGGTRMEESAEAAEGQVRARAAAEHLQLAAYRKRLQARYRRLVAIVRHGPAPGSDAE
jgi:hypothetical protein